MRLLPVGPDHVGGGAPCQQPASDGLRYRRPMSGNICRCGTYVRIREAIKRAAQSARLPATGHFFFPQQTTPCSQLGKKAARDYYPFSFFGTSERSPSSSP
jgi:hypothetical protein